MACVIAEAGAGADLHTLGGLPSAVVAFFVRIMIVVVLLTTTVQIGDPILLMPAAI